MVIDKDGNIYAGTDKGNLYKNGNHVTSFDMIIRKIIIDKDGNIYAGTSSGKIYKIDINQSNSIKTEIYDLKFKVTGLVIDKDGNFYVTNTNGKCFKL